jgi:Flp pilus assembly protein CpaB
LQNVQVLAVGQEIQNSGDVGPSLARSVTLLATPSDVPKLHLAETKGEVRLAMRGQEDRTFQETEMTTDNALFGFEKNQKADKNKESSALSFLGKLFKNPAKPLPEETDKAKKDTHEPVPESRDWSVEMVKGTEVYEVHFQTDKKGARRVEKNAGKNGATKRASQCRAGSFKGGPGVSGANNLQSMRQLASKLLTE